MWHLPFHRGAPSPTRARRTNILVSLSAIILIGMLLAACGGPTTTAQATPPPLVPLTPTATATPSPTPPLAPTPTPSPTPVPTQAPTQPPPRGPVFLDVTPSSMSIIGPKQCTLIGNVFNCTAHVISRASNPGPLNWVASDNFANNVTFSPRSGTLSPGTSVTVDILIPNDPADCNARDPLFIFRGQSNTHTIAWAC